MSIGALITGGIGPGGSIPFLLTGGLGFGDEEAAVSTTSGLITSALTVSEIIRAAMIELLAADDRGESLQAEDAKMGLKHLNWMLKSWQAEGCNIWREFEDSQVFAQGDTEKALSPIVMDVLEARIETGAGAERPLARWEWGEWVTLPNKTTQGTPSVFSVRKQRDATYLRLWPVPNASTTINYTAARVIEDVTALTQTVDIPQAWTECVYYGLAARLLPAIPLELTPARQLVLARAEHLFQTMLNFDRPASVYFRPQYNSRY